MEVESLSPSLPAQTPSYSIPGSSPGGSRKRSNSAQSDVFAHPTATSSSTCMTKTMATTEQAENNKENRRAEQDSGEMDIDKAPEPCSGEAPPTQISTNAATNAGGTALHMVSDLNTVNTQVQAQGQGQSPSLPVGNDTSGGGMPPAAKKRKLSPQEKEAKQKEKEAKERQRLEEKTKKEEEKAKREEEKAKREEEKAKKEEEKRIKEEEKKKREAEKEEEKRIKDEEKKKKDADKEEERKKRDEKKKAKEEEKAAKEEEKRKKERAQTRLNAFFVKPKSNTQAPSPKADSSLKKPAGDEGVIPNDPQDAPSAVSDYQREFPNFFLKSHMSVAPPHRFQRDSAALAHTCGQVDTYLKAAQAGSSEPLVLRPSELFRIMPYRRRRGKLAASVRDILLQMQAMEEQPESSEAAQKLRDSLKQIRMKSLRFGEDVRPPYQGTYTKCLAQADAARLMRNPFRRALPETNYDYDSEAEWEEPEEGEDLDSEDDDEGSEEGDDDMDGFLDDADDQLADGKRRQLVGDLEPVCTGIRWQEQGVDPELQTYKIETILPTVSFPIDPFSTVYWQKPKPADPGPGGRTTLQAFVNNTGPHQPTTVVRMQETSALASGKPKRAFPVEQLGEFKQAVEGSNLTKTGLVEILKKRFPKVSKDVLKDTLSSVASRVGQKEVDKKWVCR